MFYYPHKIRDNKKEKFFKKFYLRNFNFIKGEDEFSKIKNICGGEVHTIIE